MAEAKTKPTQASELLAVLGKHKMGKARLSIRCLSNVDAQVLERLIAGSVAEVERRHGAAAGAA